MKLRGVAHHHHYQISSQQQTKNRCDNSSRKQSNEINGCLIYGRSAREDESDANESWRPVTGDGPMEATGRWRRRADETTEGGRRCVDSRHLKVSEHNGAGRARRESVHRLICGRMPVSQPLASRIKYPMPMASVQITISWPTAAFHSPATTETARGLIAILNYGRYGAVFQVRIARFHPSFHLGFQQCRCSHLNLSSPFHNGTIRLGNG